MLGTPDSPHGRKGHGHRAGPRVNKRRPTTCDRGKAGSQTFFLSSARLAQLCPTWRAPHGELVPGCIHGGTYLGWSRTCREVHTYMYTCAWMCMHVCVPVHAAVCLCVCVCMCVWAYKGVCKFRCGGRSVGVLAHGCAQVRCTCTSVCQCCVHRGAHVCAYMHLGGACT